MKVLSEKHIYLKSLEYTSMSEHDKHKPFMEQDGWHEKYGELCNGKVISHYEKEIELIK